MRVQGRRQTASKKDDKTFSSAHRKASFNCLLNQVNPYLYIHEIVREESKLIQASVDITEDAITLIMPDNNIIKLPLSTYLCHIPTSRDFKLKLFLKIYV